MCVLQIGGALHQIGHVLGLLHEHTRLDRDIHVSILWNNVDKPAYLFLPNFIAWNRTTSNTYATPYDFASVMHYEPKVGLIMLYINNMQTISTQTIIQIVTGFPRASVEKPRALCRQPRKPIFH